MKESVDLTEDRLFSTSFHTEEMEVQHKFELPFYKHKDVPWERTDKGKLAKPLSLFTACSSIVLNNNFFNITSNDEFIIHDSEEMIDMGNTISFTVQRSRIDGINEIITSRSSPGFIYSNRNILVDNNINSSNPFSIRYNLINTGSNTYTICSNKELYQGLKTYGEDSLKIALDISHLVPDNSQIFPTGYKEDIIKIRKPYQSYDTERDLRSRLRTLDSKITCKICGKSIFRKEYEKKILWQTNLCEFCYNTNIHKPKKLSSSSEYFMNRFIRDESDEFVIREIHKYSVTPTRLSQCIYESAREKNNKRNKERNCLLYYDSFYDEPEIHKYQKDSYNKFYLLHHEIPILGNKNTRKLTHFDQAVYFKGKEIRRRENHWQPLGREKQWYDLLFDSMNWKDLFEKKVDSLSLQ